MSTAQPDGAREGVGEFQAQHPFGQQSKADREAVEHQRRPDEGEECLHYSLVRVGRARVGARGRKPAAPAQGPEQPATVRGANDRNAREAAGPFRPLWAVTAGVRPADWPRVRIALDDAAWLSAATVTSALGAGHVARCLRLATALERRGTRCELVGSYRGAAAELVAAAGIATRPPEEEVPAGRPSDADALMVDSYSCRTPRSRRPRVSFPSRPWSTATRPPPGSPCSPTTWTPPNGCLRPMAFWGRTSLRSIRGTLRSRRSRGQRRVLVTMGGGDAGRAALARALEEIGSRGGEYELFVAARERPAWSAGSHGLGMAARWPHQTRGVGGPRRERRRFHGVRAWLRRGAQPPDSRWPTTNCRWRKAFGRAGIAISLDARAGLDSGAGRPQLVGGARDEPRSWRRRDRPSSTATAPFGPRTVCWPGLRVATPSRRCATGRLPEAIPSCCSIGGMTPR